MVLEPLSSPHRPPVAPTVSSPPRHRRPGLIVAVVGAIGVAALIWRALAGDSGPEAAEPIATITTFTSTDLEIGDSATSPAAPAGPISDGGEPLAGPIELPPGLAGHLIAVTEGELIDLDLASGTLIRSPLAVHPRMDRIEALERSVFGFRDGEVSRMTFSSPTVEDLPALATLALVQPLAADSRSVLVLTTGPSGAELLLIDDEGTVTAAGPRAVAAVTTQSFGIVALRQGQLVVSVGQGIGLLELSSDSGRMIAQGRLIAANNEVMVRLYCEPDLTCRYQTLGYDGQERWTIEAPEAGAALFASLGRLTIDGGGLIRHVFELSGPMLEFLNLQTGKSWRVAGEGASFDPRVPPVLTADGGWYVLRTEAGAIELVSVSGDEGQRRLIALGASVQAVAMRP